MITKPVRAFSVELGRLVGTAGVLMALVTGCGSGGGGSDPVATATTVPSQTPIAPAPTFTRTTIATSIPSFTPTILNTLAPTATVPPTTLPSSTPQPSATFEFTATVELTHTPTHTEQPTSTPIPTQTPLIGPVITAFGVAENTGTFNSSLGRDPSGRPIFGRAEGDGFILYVETRTGVSGLPIATNLLSTLRDDPSGQPDLQIVSSRPLGNGSSEVCDRNFPSAGGIPAVEPPEFAFEQSVSDALNDFSCRFRIFTEPDFACTQNNNNDLTFANSGSTLQFCTLVNESFPFPQGDTVLTVRVRDTSGRAGPPAQIVIRVGS